MKRFLLALIFVWSSASAQTSQDLTDFTSLISRATPDQQAAISKARGAYNAALPVVLDAEGSPISPTPGTIDSDAGYWYFVFNTANQSYVVHYPAGQ